MEVCYQRIERNEETIDIILSAHKNKVATSSTKTTKCVLINIIIINDF